MGSHSRQITERRDTVIIGDGWVQKRGVPQEPGGELFFVCFGEWQWNSRNALVR